MAYLSLVEYDAGGTIRSLDGLAAVTYDDGAKRNLVGAHLGAVKYDDGGRFRTLIGLGQDPALDIPTDLPLTPPSSFVPIEYAPPTPAPFVDTISAPNNQELIPPTLTPVPPTFYQPLVTVDTQSTPVTGSLVGPTAPAGPTSAGTLVSVAAPAANALTSIFSGIKNIFSGGSTQVKPITAGTLAPAPVAASWFSQPSAIVSGLPNWAMLGGIAVIGTVLVISLKGSGGGGGSRRRNPGRRRRNPAELLLMGANPSWRFYQGDKRTEKDFRTKKEAQRHGRKLQRKTGKTVYGYGPRNEPYAWRN
jgi:hypothetical protein